MNKFHIVNIELSSSETSLDYYVILEFTLLICTIITDEVQVVPS